MMQQTPAEQLTKDDLVFIPVADAPITKSGLAIDTDPVLEGIGSSAIVDREGDILTAECLQSLAESANDAGFQTAYRDHRYDADNVLGALAYQPALTMTADMSGRQVAALKVGVRVFMDNPGAARAVRMVEKGIKLGYSVGFIPTEYDYRRDDRGAPLPSLQFDKSLWREVSSTTMPANPISWISTVVRSLTRKGILPHPEDVNELAYIAKRWHDLDALEGVRLVRLARAIERKAISITAAGLMGDREYATLTDTDKTDLARQIAGALHLAASA